MLRGKFISINTYVRKQETSQINIVSFHVTNLKKEELIKHQPHRKEENSRLPWKSMKYKTKKKSFKKSIKPELIF